jgi:hypothetical protein
VVAIARVPYRALGFGYCLLYARVAAVEFGFHEANDVCSDVVELGKGFNDIGAIVGEAETIYVLEVDTDYLVFPDFGWIVTLALVDAAVLLPFVRGIEKILKAVADRCIGRGVER